MEFDTILRQGEKALTGLNAEALSALYAPEFLLEDTASGSRISNKAELREYYDRLFSLPECHSQMLAFSHWERELQVTGPGVEEHNLEKSMQFEGLHFSS